MAEDGRAWEEATNPSMKQAADNGQHALLCLLVVGFLYFAIWIYSFAILVFALLFYCALTLIYLFFFCTTALQYSVCK